MFLCIWSVYNHSVVSVTASSFYDLANLMLPMLSNDVKIMYHVILLANDTNVMSAFAISIDLGHTYNQLMGYSYANTIATCWNWFYSF